MARTPDYSKLDTDTLWRKLKSPEGNKRTKIQIRNALILKYLYLAQYHAERVYAKTPPEVELDDLVIAGVLGMIDAIDAYDPTRGVKFQTFAGPRIRGAVLDELRSTDWSPRLTRMREHQLNRIRDEVESNLGQSASDDDIRRHLGVSRQEYHNIVEKANTIKLGRLDRDTSSDKRTAEDDYDDMLADTQQPAPSDDIQRQDSRTKALQDFNREERLIIILYYYEDLTMKEIAKVINISESRVSQLHKSVLDRMKTNRNTNSLREEADANNNAFLHGSYTERRAKK